jgi:hypothetical protein
MQEFWQHDRFAFGKFRNPFRSRAARLTQACRASSTIGREWRRPPSQKNRQRQYYEAVLPSTEAKSHLLDEVLAFFGGRAQPIMAHLVETGKLTRKHIRDTAKLIAELERKGKKC